jgi:hypothetical protein
MGPGRTGHRAGGRSDGPKLLKAVTLKEIEQIFSVTDPLGITREAIVIPLRTEHPGHVRMIKDRKIEIVVEREGDFEEWLRGLGARIEALMKREPD